MKLQCYTYDRLYKKNVIYKKNKNENNVVHIWCCYMIFLFTHIKNMSTWNVDKKSKNNYYEFIVKYKVYVDM